MRIAIFVLATADWGQIMHINPNYDHGLLGIDSSNPTGHVQDTPFLVAVICGLA